MFAVRKKNYHSKYSAPRGKPSRSLSRHRGRSRELLGRSAQVFPASSPSLQTTRSGKHGVRSATRHSPLSIWGSAWNSCSRSAIRDPTSSRESSPRSGYARRRRTRPLPDSLRVGAESVERKHSRLGQRRRGQIFLRQPPRTISAAAELKTASPLFCSCHPPAASAENSSRSWEIIGDMAAGFSALSRSGTNYLVPLHNEEYPPCDHEEDILNRQSRRSGMLLCFEELVHFLTLPNMAASERTAPGDDEDEVSAGGSDRW